MVPMVTAYIGCNQAVDVGCYVPVFLFLYLACAAQL